MRDCMNCVNHTKDGCKVWNCKFTTVEDAKTEFAIEKLEKIKSEIKEELDNWESYPSQDGMVFSFMNSCKKHIKLIDKHIEELKGEQE